MTSHFGHLLLNFRLRTCALQKQIAHTAGIDESYLAVFERGRRPFPTSAVIERLSKSLAQAGMDRAVLRDTAAAAIGASVIQSRGCSSTSKLCRQSD